MNRREHPEVQDDLCQARRPQRLRLYAGLCAMPACHEVWTEPDVSTTHRHLQTENCRSSGGHRTVDDDLTNMNDARISRPRSRFSGIWTPQSWTLQLSCTPSISDLPRRAEPTTVTAAGDHHRPHGDCGSERDLLAERLGRNDEVEEMLRLGFLI